MSENRLRGRLSLNVSGFGALEPSIALTVTAEDAGFDGVYFAEHVGFHDAIVPAALALARTTRIEVGVMGPTPTTRHPVVLAMEVASLDEAAPGRVRVQVGTGDPFLMTPVGGMASRPVAAVERLVTDLRRALEGERVTGEVAAFRSDGAKLYTGARHVPIDVLAIRPRMMSLAARVGDGVSLTAGASPRYLSETVAHIEKELADAGRDRADFRIVAAVTASVARDIDTAAERVRSVLSMWAPQTFAIVAPDVAGTGPVKDWPADLLGRVAVVATPEAIEGALEPFVTSGVNELAVGFVDPPEEVENVLRRVADAHAKLTGR